MFFLNHWSGPSLSPEEQDMLSETWVWSTSAMLADANEQPPTAVLKDGEDESYSQFYSYSQPLQVALDMPGTDIVSILSSPSFNVTGMVCFLFIIYVFISCSAV